MATSTLQTNAVNDLYLADGRNLIVISGIPACEQNIRQATLMRLGEDVYNTMSGVDYFGLIFCPNPNPDAAAASIAKAILACPDVISVESLSITMATANNSFGFVASVITIYSPIPTQVRSS